MTTLYRYKGQNKFHPVNGGAALDLSGVTDPGGGEPDPANNKLTIQGDWLYLNNQPIKLMGVRTASATDSQYQTDHLISQLDEYKAHGVNSVTVYYMGSRNANYDPFSTDGTTVDAGHQARMEQIIQAADARGMVVIVGIFYQAAPIKLANRAAFDNAVRTVTSSLTQYDNIIINIANEQNSTGYERIADKADINDPQVIREMAAIVHEEDPDRIVGGGGYNQSNNIELGLAPEIDILLFDTGGGDRNSSTLYSNYLAAGVTKPMINVEVFGGFTNNMSDGQEGVFSASEKKLYTDEVDRAAAHPPLGLFFHNGPWMQVLPMRYNLGGQGTAADPGVRWYFEHVRDTIEQPVGDPNPGPDPDPEPDPDPPSDPADIPPAYPSWTAAVATRDLANVVEWYEEHTGHEGTNPDNPNDIPLSVGDLTWVEGGIQSTHDGQVIEGLHSSYLRISHNNVTVRRCRITEGALYGAYYNPTFGNTYHGLVIEYCTFESPSFKETVGLLLAGNETPGKDRAIVRHNNISGFASGMRLYNSGRAEYNYFHDLAHPPGVHSNSARAVGVGPALFLRNFGTDGTSGNISIYYDKEPTANIRYQENIMSGTIHMPDGRVISPEASPSYHIAMKPGDYGPTAVNIEIIDNYFALGYQYGLLTGGNVPWGSGGNRRSGNVIFETGELAPVNTE